MIKLLVCTEAFEMNGVLRSLLDFLDALDPKRYDISLFAFDGRLPSYVTLPGSVRVLPIKPEYAIARMPFAVAWRWALKHGHVWLLLKRVFFTLLGKVNGRYSKFRLISEGSALNGDWDVACAYSMGYLWKFVARKVQARRKLLWLHTDPFSAPHLGTWNRIKHHISSVDALICVSNGIRDVVRERCREIASKTYCVHNIVDVRALLAKSGKGGSPVRVPGRLRLVTIGRFSPQKKQELIPAMAKIAKDAGIEFEWYLVGPGAQKARAEKESELSRLGVAENLHYVEGMENPYPLMKSADIYVQPSWYEGWGLTLTEALVLGCYCLATDIPSFREQIVESWQGLLLPLDVKAFGAAIVSAARHPEILHPQRRYQVPWTAEATVEEFEEVLRHGS